MGTMKLSKMTIRSLFTKPETIMYPVEERPQPDDLKGHIANNIENCTLCGVCAKRCPSGALSVDKAAGTWTINGFDCIQCRVCVRECPQNCLSMMPTYTKPSQEKTVRVATKPEPSEEEKAAKEAAKAAKIKAALEAKAAREKAKAEAEAQGNDAAEKQTDMGSE